MDPYAKIAKPVGDYDAISRPVSKPAPKKGFVNDVVGTMSGAVQNVRDKYDAYTAEGEARAEKLKTRAREVGGLRAFAESVVDPAKEKGPGLSDLAAVPLSPIAGVVHGVLRPGAEAIAKRVPTYSYGSAGDQARQIMRGKIPEQRRLSEAEAAAKIEGDVINALSAAVPARGVVGLSGPSALRTTATRAPKVNALAEGIAEFDRAGVRPSLAAVQGGGSAKVANALAENAVAGYRARPAMAGTVADVEASAARVAGKYGAPASRGAAGEAVQEGIQDFNTRFSQRANDNYTRAFRPIEQAEAAAVSRGVTVTPAATSQAVNEIWGGVNSPALREMIVDPRIAKIGKALSDDPASLRFNDLRAARTWVREAQSDEALRAGMSQGSLKRLEKALTDDIMTNAENLAGPQAARRLRQTDQFYRLGSERISKQLQTFVGKGAPKAGEGTYDVILRAAGDKGGADYQRLIALKKSLKPDEWGDVAASTIARMGGVEGKDFSINTFVTSLENLSAGGKSALFGTGELRAELENLQKVATKVKAVEKGANASNSATSLQNLASAGALINPGTFLPTAQLLGSLTLTAEAVTNPAFVRWVARLGASKSPKTLAANVQQLQIAARRNQALLPLYQQAVLMLEAPKVSSSTIAEEPSR